VVGVTIRQLSPFAQAPFFRTTRAAVVFLQEMLLLIAAERAAVESVPDLIELPVETGRQAELLAVHAAGVQPEVGVRVRGVGVQEADGPALRKAVAQPLADQSPDDVGGHGALKGEQGAEVGPALPLPTEGSQLRRFPRPGIAGQVGPQLRVALRLRNPFRHVLEHQRILAVPDRRRAADVTQVGGGSAGGPLLEPEEGPHGLEALPDQAQQEPHVARCPVDLGRGWSAPAQQPGAVRLPR